VSIHPPDTPPSWDLGVDHGRAADALWWALVAGDPQVAEPVLAALAVGSFGTDDPNQAERCAQLRRVAGAPGQPGARTVATLGTFLGHCQGCHQAA
jgi:mono/diheme cytochrome c family protein